MVVRRFCPALTTFRPLAFYPCPSVLIRGSSFLPSACFILSILLILSKVS